MRPIYRPPYQPPSAAPRSNGGDRRSAWSDAAGLALLALSLYAAFSVVEDADWVRGLPPLIVPILLALLLGYWAHRTGWGRRFSYPFLVAAGAGVAAGLGVPLLDDGAHTAFGLFFLAAAWSVSLISLGLFISGRWPLLTPLPGLIMVTICLGFLDAGYFYHLPLFLAASAPLAAFQGLRRRAGGGAGAARAAPVALGLVMVAAAAVAGWASPSPQGPVRPGPVAAAMEDRLFDVWEGSASIFRQIPNRKGWPRFNLHPTLTFQGPIEQSEEVIMHVEAEEPSRWRLRVYETYTAQGWVRDDGAPIAPESEAPAPAAALPRLREREEAPIRVRLFSTNTHVATAGLPLRSDVDGLRETSPQPAFYLDLADPSAAYLPPDLLDFRSDLVASVASASAPRTLQERLGEAGLELTAPLAEGAPPLDAPITVRRTLNNGNPSTALLFPRSQGPPRAYSTLGSVSTANALQLREAARGSVFDPGRRVEYPQPVTDRYLQLPPNFPDTVRELARVLARGRNSSYDVAISIQDYLHTLSYSEGVNAPPPGVDAVEWFLTKEQVGFCNYFASAMITMLRSLGIPARMVVGFAPGEYDDDRDAWIVRSKHYHAWPEVYFPNYGWVEFEPTPASVQPSLADVGGPAQRSSSVNPNLQDECLELVFECEDPVGDLDEEEEFLPEDLGAVEAAAPAPPAAGGALTEYVVWLLVAVGVMAGGILSFRLYVRHLTNRLGPAAAAYGAVSLFGRMAGIRRRPQETPAEFGARLAAALPGDANAFLTITDAYQRAAYSRDKSLPADRVAELRSAWNRARPALIRLALRRLSPRREGRALHPSLLLRPPPPQFPRPSGNPGMNPSKPSTAQTVSHIPSTEGE